MALTSGTVHSVETLRANITDPLQYAHILFTMSGTYDQSANSSLVGVAALISASRRNGKTINLVSAAPGQMARKDSNAALLMGLKTVSISSGDAIFEITESATAGVPDFTTELAAATIPAQSQPFGVLIGFYET